MVSPNMNEVVRNREILDSSQGSFERRRVASACVRCRKRKSKCSGSIPCTYCAKHSYQCIFDNVRKRPYFRDDNGNGSEISFPVEKKMVVADQNKPDRSSLADISDKISGVLELCGSLHDEIKRLNKKVTKLEEELPRRSDADAKNGIKGAENGAAEKDIEFPILSQTLTSEYPDPFDTPDVTDDPSSNDLPVERISELLSELSPFSFFSKGCLEKIQKSAGPNFEMFRLWVGKHAQFLHKLAKNVKNEFNNLSSNLDIFLYRPQSVRCFFRAFLQTHAKVVLEHNEVFDLYYRFYKVSPSESYKLVDYSMPDWPRKEGQKPLNDSEMLAFSVLVCLGSSFISGRIRELSATNRSVLPTNDEYVVTVPLSELKEIEQISMNNCFYYFSRVQNKVEGKISITAMFLLIVYLNSTVYSKFNYFILSVGIRQAEKLHYNDLPCPKFHTNPSSMRSRDELWARKLLWLKLYSFDREVSSTLQKPSLIKSGAALIERDFISMVKYFIEKHYFVSPDHRTGPNLLELLKEVEFEGLKVRNHEKVFEVLHHFAQVCRDGYNLLLYYTSYCISSLVTSFSKEDYLSNILKAIERIKKTTSPLNRGSALSKLYESLDRINDFTRDFEERRKAIPANCSPEMDFDISIYKYKDPEPSAAEFIKGTTSDNKNSRIKFGDYFMEQLEDDGPAAASLLVIVQYKFHYQFMQSHKIARRACELIGSDDKLLKSLSKYLNMNFHELKTSFVQRAQEFRNKVLHSARVIQRFTLAIFPAHSHAISWCFTQINLSYMALFSEIMETVLPEGLSHESWLRQKVADLHLMIECFTKCLSNCRFPVDDFDSDSKGLLHISLIQLCAAHLKDSGGVNLDNDGLVQNFLSMIKEDPKKNSRVYLDPSSEAARDYLRTKDVFPLIGSSSTTTTESVPSSSSTSWNNNGSTPKANIDFNFALLPNLGKTFFTLQDFQTAQTGSEELAIGKKTESGKYESQLFIQDKVNGDKDGHWKHDGISKDEFDELVNGPSSDPLAPLDLFSDDNDLMLNLLELDPFSMSGYFIPESPEGM